jgi:TetR/AcrR family transcriptional regulator, transcriptional repressor for nem operon
LAGIEGPRQNAFRLTALLQGAMLQAVALDDVAAFDAALEEFHNDPPPVSATSG